MSTMRTTPQDLYNIAQGVEAAISGGRQPINTDDETYAEYEIFEYSYFFQETEYVISARVTQYFNAYQHEEYSGGYRYVDNAYTPLNFTIEYISVIKIVGDDYDEMEITPRDIERQELLGSKATKATDTTAA